MTVKVIIRYETSDGRSFEDKDNANMHKAVFTVMGRAGISENTKAYYAVQGILQHYNLTLKESNHEQA